MDTAILTLSVAAGMWVYNGQEIWSPGRTRVPCEMIEPLMNWRTPIPDWAVCYIQTQSNPFKTGVWQAR